MTSPRDLGQTRVMIVGLHSAGKSTLARLLASSAGGHVVELGDCLRRIARRQGSKNLVELAHELLADDPICLAKEALDRSRHAPGLVVVVGPRTSVEFEFLLANLPNILSIGIDTPPELRLKRWHNRHLRFTDSWEERETREREWNTSKLIDRVDVVLHGSEELNVKLEAVIGALAQHSSQ